MANGNGDDEVSKAEFVWLMTKLGYSDREGTESSARLEQCRSITNPRRKIGISELEP